MGIIYTVSIYIQCLHDIINQTNHIYIKMGFKSKFSLSNSFKHLTANFTANRNPVLLLRLLCQYCRRRSICFHIVCYLLLGRPNTSEHRQMPPTWSYPVKTLSSCVKCFPDVIVAKSVQRVKHKTGFKLRYFCTSRCIHNFKLRVVYWETQSIRIIQLAGGDNRVFRELVLFFCR